MLTSNSSLLSKCFYMSCRRFNSILSDNSNSICFSLFHLNIRSLNKHFVDLQGYLSTLNTSFWAIALSETWLEATSNDLYNFSGYNLIVPDLLEQEVVLAYILVIAMNSRKGVTLKLPTVLFLNPSLLRYFNQRMRKISSFAVYTNPLMLARRFSLPKSAKLGNQPRSCST